ncbi:hypothetical protein HPB52_001488 [Rhipicephalus sanguineus]|uniref:Uncharacterized protein n=1 Tax=Rhipicephalus sanguineus TaxID=34632 RepID=A0A9D4PFF2_RHISA|nr:hypothetical protein HPB52_001488 [Rhipicephalus sanguineus]
MTVEGVLPLTETTTWWLPNATSASKGEAIRYIRNALEAIGSMDQRVMAIAWLYCWLAEREALDPWWTYCLSRSSTTGPYRFCLHERLSSLLEVTGERTSYEKIEREDAVYVCIMTTFAPPASVDHNVLCLCIPRTLPYLFVHVAGNKQRLNAFIRQAFEQPMWKIQSGPHRDLGYAFEKARMK